MDVLTQTNFPRLWDWFQFWIGGTIDKREMCQIGVHGNERILEVGCSTGNIAEAFRRFPKVDYVGLDIDQAVLSRAESKFRKSKNLHFTSTPFLEYRADDQKFDIVLFAGMFHHITDEMIKDFLAHSTSLLKENGSVIVVDPLLPEDNDPGIFRFFSKLEKGQFVRSGEHMMRLLKQSSKLKLVKDEIHFMGATPWSHPKVLRFGRYELKPVNQSTSS